MCVVETEQSGHPKGLFLEHPSFVKHRESENRQNTLSLHWCIAEWNESLTVLACVEVLHHLAQLKPMLAP